MQQIKSTYPEQQDMFLFDKREGKTYLSKLEMLLKIAKSEKINVL